MAGRSNDSEPFDEEVHLFDIGHTNLSSKHDNVLNSIVEEWE